MLNYDTCVLLKEAGFPFPDRDTSNECNYPHEDVTLSELIEACGDGVQTIFKQKDNVWCAFGYSTSPSGNGTTISEAVAHFWLALNNK